MFTLIILIIVLGLIIGSFLGAYTYRAPRDISITKGRSFCPKCKNKIQWFDNIPLFSYIILGAKCRKCKKRIGFREPGIEIATMFVFLAILSTSFSCFSSGYFSSAPFCTISSGVNQFIFLIYMLILGAIFVSIFVIDFENKLILDEEVFGIFVLTFFYTLLFKNDYVFENLLAGLLVAIFYLFLHLITLGKGMGLGDVKLALVGGTLLGMQYALLWTFLSFVVGGALGIILILVRKVEFGKQIPFGPFMIFGLAITMFFGDRIIGVLLPF